MMSDDEEPSDDGRDFIGSEMFDSFGTDDTFDKPEQLTRRQRIRGKTERQMEEWTKDMVVIDVVEMILQRILLGWTWITITGAPGEGKTTAAYLVMKRLHEQGKNVYDIRTPLEYEAKQYCPNDVLLFNDMFGSSEFDLSRTKSWEPVLDDLLEMREHRGIHQEKAREASERVSHGPKKEHDTGHGLVSPIILLVSRNYILNSASAYLGRYNDLILSSNNTFNLTKQYQLSESDRKQIYDYYTRDLDILNKHGIFNATCSIAFHHGFPHCCRLFVDMYSRNRDINSEMFFLKPLKFLNQTIKTLFNDQTAVTLFKEMLKCDGSLNLDGVENDDKKLKWQRVASALKDTYLDVRGGKLQFNHPSVYDSVAVVLSDIDPSFVISKCRLLLLKERIRFKKQKCDIDPDSNVIVVLDDICLGQFQERLKAAIKENQIFLTISHSMFDDECFVNGLMDSLVKSSTGRLAEEESLRNLMFAHDDICKRTFLYLSSSSGSNRLLRYICKRVKLSPTEQKQTLFGICEFAAVKPLLFFMSEFQDFDLDEARNSENKSPLMVASTTRNSEFLQHLLMNPVDLKPTDSQNRTAFHFLCEHGIDDASEIVQQFIEKGADINLKSGSFLHSPLHTCCKKGHSEVVRELIKGGADVRVRDKYGYTPFRLACSTGQVEVVEAVLSCGGVDVDETDEAGFTSLHNAAVANDEDLVQILLNNDADVKKLDKHGDTPLHKACRRGYARVVNKLLDKDIDINLKARGGETPLHCATRGGHLEVVQLLLDKGADINAVTVAKTSAVQMACFNGHAEILKLLLKEKANMTMHSPTQLLDKACWRGHVGVINVLLENNADINERNPIGHTPLQQAACRGHVEAVIALIEKGADMTKTSPLGYTPLHCASYNGHPDAVETLIEKGSDKTRQASDGETPIHKACFRGQTNVLPVLVSKGVDINLKSRKGDTPLHIASAEGHNETVIFLVEHGAAVNSINKRGETPLYGACGGGHRNVVKTLLAMDADPNIANKDGDTALHISCRDGGIEAVTVLLDTSVDINVKNKQGQTPLDLLCKLPWQIEGVLMLVKQFLQIDAD